MRPDKTESTGYHNLRHCKPPLVISSCSYVKYANRYI
jgi:hypothetical protein